ncbi:MAG: hypothetical protein ACOYJG_11120 [Prevotella sp.]|jgi:hypothetical protein
MKQIQHQLQIHYWSWLALTLLVVVVFETDVLPVGYWATEKSREFVLAFIMEILTIGVIPFALWMFKWKRVSRRLQQGGEKALYNYSLLRMYLLIIPMFVNTLLYYAFMNVAFGYMGIILFLSLFFIFPSKARYQQELKEHQPNEDPS